MPAPLSGQSFCAAHSTMPRGASPAFYLLPGRTCSLPFGKKRKIPRSSMRCRLNQCRGLHLLSPHPRFLLSSLALSQLPALALPTFCLRSRSAPGLCAQAVPIYHPFPAKQKKSPQALFLFRLFLVLRAALPPLRWQRRRWQLSCLSACRQTPRPYAPNTSRAIATDACTSAA